MDKTKINKTMNSKAPKASKASNKENVSQKNRRSARFSEAETDLLCNLIVASDVNTSTTNKMTPYGRLKSWEDITRMFNASPNVIVLWVFFFVFIHSFKPFFPIQFNLSCFSNANNVYSANVPTISDPACRNYARIRSNVYPLQVVDIYHRPIHQKCLSYWRMLCVLTVRQLAWNCLVWLQLATAMCPMHRYSTPMHRQTTTTQQVHLILRFRHLHHQCQLCHLRICSPMTWKQISNLCWIPGHRHRMQLEQQRRRHQNRSELNFFQPPSSSVAAAEAVSRRRRSNIIAKKLG